MTPRLDEQMRAYQFGRFDSEIDWVVVRYVTQQRRSARVEDEKTGHPRWGPGITEGLDGQGREGIYVEVSMTIKAME